jgi:hypothetical protein
MLINERATTSTRIETVTVPAGDGGVLAYIEHPKPPEIWVAVKVAVHLGLVK